LGAAIGVRAALTAARKGHFRAYARRLARRRAHRLGALLLGPSSSRRRLAGRRARLGAEILFARLVGRRPTLPYIETHLVDHCNLNCRSCSHYSPLSPERFVDPEMADRDFARLAALFGRVGLLRLMGGEPLLHPELERFVVSARTHLPDAAIAIVTNGVLLGSQPDSFWELLASRRIRLDVTDYPIGLSRERIEARASEAGVVVDFGAPIRQFKTVPMDPRGTRDPDEMYRLCGAAPRCPFLRSGSVYLCARIAMSGILAERFGVGLPVCDADRLALDEARGGSDVLRFLARSVPWCRFCGREATTDFDWARSSGARDEWLTRGPAADAPAAD
jgi:hypothetical protein